MNSVGIVAAALCMGSVGLAGQVGTVPEMDAILGDQILLEDFEGVSVHGGSTLACPNPLSSATVPSYWNLIPGATYSAAGTLKLYGGFLDGDDSNILQGATLLTILFDAPQLGAGFRVIDSTGNIPYHDVITFYHGTQVLGVVEVDLAPATDAFAGWQDEAGITSITVTSTGTGFTGLPTIDNLEWGVDVGAPACIGDVNTDGATDISDFNVLAGNFGAPVAPNTSGDLNGDGLVNISDFNILVAGFGCGG